MHAGHSGPLSKAPKKAGMAESGASALKELEKTMVVPCAKHMYGIGTVEVTASQQVGSFCLVSVNYFTVFGELSPR